jgi:parallel beta-helix repeat protein
MINERKHVLILTLIFCLLLGVFICSFNIPEILKTSKNDNIKQNYEKPRISTNHDTLFIDGNNMFANNASNEGWIGNGTYSNPYIIENYDINATLSHGIEIRNTNLYFIIKNVTVINGRSNYNYGFYLANVTNGKLINNTADNHLAGFLLWNSDNNTFTDNLATNSLHGFRVWYSDNNTLTNNTANDNIEYGIFLDTSNNNTITKNIVLLNGIGSVYEINSMGNDISDNICGLQSFVLFSDADGFDEDGSFKLTWTVSENADNYTLYQNGVILVEGLTITNYNITDLAIGTYQFYVKAINKYEERDSNIVEVTVSYIIHVDGNTEFHQTATAQNFTGNGTYSNPYIIENYEIIASTGHGIHIQNTDIYFIIKNVGVSNGRSNNYFGFYLENVTNGRLEDNTANNNVYGFLLKDSYNNTLEGNTALDNLNGIKLNFSTYNNLTYNNISNNRHGLSLASSYYNSLIGNEVTDNTYLGVYLDSSNNNSIIENTATGNLNGFTLSSSNNNTITNNTANDNDQHGFHLWHSNNNIVTNNIANNNLKYGIYLEESKFNEISGNTLEGNGLGPLYEKTSDEEDFPDIFLISAIIAVIAIASFVIIKITLIITKKKITLSGFKLSLKKLLRNKNE